MKCPLKFGLYEFEGGTGCIGAECGFFGCVCGAANLKAERDELINAINELQKKQPYCYNPEAPLDTLRTVGCYIDELKAERDELKKRVGEQQETLDNDCRDLIENDNEICKLTAERDEWKAKAEQAKESSAHSKAHSKDAPTLSEQSESLSDSREKLRIVMPRHNGEKYAKLMVKQFDQLIYDELHDSREKLEADVLKFSQVYYANHLLVYDKVIELLDRQKAITERKCLAQSVQGADAILTAENAELQAKVDELTEQLESAHAKNRALKLHISKMQAGRHGWHVRGVELQKRVDELTTQLHASNAERERLRECLGIATDNAHDFLTLVDESGNVYDRDEGLA